MNVEELLLTVTIAVTIILAFIGYLYNIQMAKRDARLDLVNKRIAEFYGPLYVATRTSEKSYNALLQKLGKRAVFTDKEDPPTEEDIAEWLVWAENVFMPTNELVERLIIEKAYLIREEEMPGCLLQFITHVSGYRAVLHKWQGGDFTELLSIIEYPVELDEYATESYRELKKTQLDLIGK